MQTDLKSKILNALAGSSSQKPVGTTALYPLGTQKRVKATLMELYLAREVCCCMITHNSLIGGHLYWWLSGAVSLPHSYCRTTTKTTT